MPPTPRQQFAEEARIAAEHTAAKDYRIGAEQKAAKEAQIAAEQKAAKEAQIAAEQKVAEEARIAAEQKLLYNHHTVVQKAAKEARIAAEQKVAEDTLRSGSRAPRRPAQLLPSPLPAIRASLAASTAARIAPEQKAAQEAHRIIQFKGESKRWLVFVEVPTASPPLDDALEIKAKGSLVRQGRPAECTNCGQDVIRGQAYPGPEGPASICQRCYRRWVKQGRPPEWSDSLSPRNTGKRKRSPSAPRKGQPAQTESMSAIYRHGMQQGTQPAAPYGAAVPVGMVVGMMPGPMPGMAPGIVPALMPTMITTNPAVMPQQLPGRPQPSAGAWTSTGSGPVASATGGPKQRRISADNPASHDKCKDESQPRWLPTSLRMSRTTVYIANSIFATTTGELFEEMDKSMNPDLCMRIAGVFF